MDYRRYDILIAIITDTHYGCRGDAILFLDYFKKFTDNVFFPVLKQRGISHVIHLGDLVDRRKFINFNTAKRMREDLIEPLSKIAMIDVIAGNHDTMFKTTNEVNALQELLKSDQINTYTDAVTIEYDGVPILLVPWISPENQERSFNEMKETKAQICMGHFQIQGFEMHTGTFCTNGLDVGMFAKFDMVMSGHFHKKSRAYNIHYLGSPWETTWADYDEPKGFHIFDTETRELEFIQNPYTLFEKIKYNDVDMLGLPTNIHAHADKFVKLIVEEKTNSYLFDRYVDALDKVAFDLKIIDQKVTMASMGNIEVKAVDSATVLQHVIEQADIDYDKEKLKTFLMDLYIEASHMEAV